MNISDSDIQLARQLATMQPITLEEMAGIRLMNRLDTKYVTTRACLMELLSLIQNQYYVQETNNFRICPYRTTYLDTENHAFYMMHHNRHATRMKVRVRTYMTSDDLTFLEVKNKNNHGRTKKHRLCVSSVERCHETEGASRLVSEFTGIELGELHPVVRNNFNRVTLVNKGKTERLTIDLNVRFHNWETQKDGETGNLVIIELKRDGNIFSPIRSVLHDLHIHPTGFSKCCIGMAMTDDKLKTNNFKEKLHLVDKMRA